MECTPEQSLQKLGIILPPPPEPVANYVNAIRVGKLMFLSGEGPLKSDGSYVLGKLGKDLTVEEGYNAVRLAAICHLSILKAELGQLKRVARIVKVHAMVNCTNDFAEQSTVVNGYSDLMVAVFGEKGKHVRSAVGINALPMNIATEVELTVEIEE